MSDTMGTFRVDVEVENLMRPGERRVVRAALVDTRALLSWFPAEELEALGIAISCCSGPARSRG